MTATCVHDVPLDLDCATCAAEQYCDLCEADHLPELSCAEAGTAIDDHFGDEPYDPADAAPDTQPRTLEQRRAYEASRHDSGGYEGLHDM